MEEFRALCNSRPFSSIPFGQWRATRTAIVERVEMVWPKKPITVVVRTDGDAKQYQVNAWTLFGSVAGMILWVVICSAAWFISARGDYANLAIARACYSENAQIRAADSKCDGIGSPDTYMSEVNRKARISRLAAAAGAGLGCMVLIATRRKRGT